jgi:hypothetical protein
VGAGRRFDVTVGLEVVTERVVVGVAAVVVVVASACASGSGDDELHALPNNSATTMALVIDESLRITELCPARAE